MAKFVEFWVYSYFKGCFDQNSKCSYVTTAKRTRRTLNRNVRVQQIELPRNATFTSHNCIILVWWHQEVILKSEHDTISKGCLSHCWSLCECLMGLLEVQCCFSQKKPHTNLERTGIICKTDETKFLNFVIEQSSCISIIKIDALEDVPIYIYKLDRVFI